MKNEGPVSTDSIAITSLDFQKPKTQNHSKELFVSLLPPFPPSLFHRITRFPALSLSLSALGFQSSGQLSPCADSAVHGCLLGLRRSLLAKLPLPRNVFGGSVCTETESMGHDATDHLMDSGGSDSRPVEVEENSQIVNNVDAQVGGLEKVECTISAQPCAGDTLITVPDEDAIDEAKQTRKGTKDNIEASQPNVHNKDEIKANQPSEDVKNGVEANQPSEDAKEKVELKQPREHARDEAKPPIFGILDKSDAHKKSKRMVGGSSNGESLHLNVTQPGSASRPRGDHPVHNSTGSRSPGRGYEKGDMVWGKVKSHPWWPGQIFNEAFASSSVWRTRKDGQFLVAFFGDSSYGWFDPAELIPYEPHFVEKSQQSTSKNFLKAVEESVDEACRRSALGLTCFCRNPRNFRPTNVPGHMAVDVFDYEPGGIYSRDQIQKARDNFLPERTLSFVEQLAAAPQKPATSLDFGRDKAVALAFRKAVFEEFDETYAQAFGQDPVRPVVAPPPSVDQSVQAHLSGPFVVAESFSGGRKGSAKAVKSREHSKKDKYLFKRRDGHDDMETPQMEQPGNSTFLSPSSSEDKQPNAAAADFILQKRDHPVSHRDQQEGATPAKDDSPPSSSSAIKASSSNEDKVAADNTVGAKKSDPPVGKIKKDGLLKGGVKRSSAEKPDLGEKRKKKRKITDSQGSPDQQKQLSAGNVVTTPRKDLSSVAATEKVPVVSSEGSGIVSAAATENNNGDLRRALADLKILAQDHFYGKTSNVPAMTRQIFLKYRSLVFQKSLPALPSASGDTETSDTRSARPSSGGAGTSSENTRGTPLPRPPRPLGKIDDPTKGGKKRVLSERLDEAAAKRAKKLSAMKSAMSTEKRKTIEMQHLDGKGKALVRTGAKADPSARAQPPKSRVEEHTFLMMKYPPGTSLPSGAELKARFGRFGPMDTNQQRIFYSTNTCRVMFLYKEDAERAYRFALGNRSTFADVRFMLKPHTVGPDPQAGRDTNRAGDDSDHPQPPPVMQPRSAVQPKSILKKPAGDENGTQNTGGARAARVRFNVGEGKTSGNTSSSLGESGGSGSAADVRNNNQRQHKVGLKLQPLQPPLVTPPQPHHNNPPNVEVAPRNHAQHYAQPDVLPLPPPPPSRPPPVDISQQMLSLLTRCNDVVTNVKSALGYIPYHPL